MGARLVDITKGALGMKCSGSKSVAGAALLWLVAMVAPGDLDMDEDLAGVQPSGEPLAYIAIP